MTRDDMIAQALANLHKHWPKGARRTADNRQIAAVAVIEFVDKHLATPIEGDWLKVSQRAAANAIADAYREQAHVVSMSKDSHRRGTNGTSKAAAAVIAHSPASLDSPDTPELEAPDTHAGCDARIRLAQLIKAASITLDLQDMLTLRFGLDGDRPWSFAEIAKRYGCTTAGAQKRIERAMAQLRRVEQ